MNQRSCDLLVIGSGFGGSLMALGAQRIGLKVVLIESGSHPRFAIGESSTPLADLTLRGIADRYDLPRIRPLTEYGAWCRTYPKLMRGLKRGFSYFHHCIGGPFVPHEDHRNELLVAANPDDEHADTHWLRADVDAFLVDEAVSAGVTYLDRTEIATLDAGDPWKITVRQNGAQTRIEVPLVIDAMGGGGVLADTLEIADDRDHLHTNSRAIYTHFRGVKRWHNQYRRSGGRYHDHPFDCDAAALHHVFDGGWMWILRFDDDVVSAGIMLDHERFPLVDDVSAADEWKQWLSRYPSIAEQFVDSEPLYPLTRTGRVQRLRSQCAGTNWAMLPHAVGFIDPLHSSGIAHTLSGVERLLAILEDGRNTAAAFQRYHASIRREFELLDQLIHGCYAGFDRFELLAIFSMTYFGAAIGSEHRRRDVRHDIHDGFLMAHDESFRRTVDDLNKIVCGLAASHGNPAAVDRDRSDSATLAQLEADVATSIPEGNPAGLCDRAKRNMYEYA